VSKKYLVADDIDPDVEEVGLKDGSRLTNERAERIATDVLKQRDRGRPSLPGTTETSPRLRSAQRRPGSA
jgi:hypothetical protein